MKINSVQSMLVAGVFFALMNICVKYIPHIPAIEIVLFRSLFSLIFSFVILKKQKVNIFGNNKPLLIARGVSGAIALIAFFYTLQNIPLASAVTINYLGPIFTTIIGIFLLKQKVKPIQFLFFAISFAGILIIQGYDSRVDPFWSAMGLLSAVFMGLAYNIVSKLKATEHPLVVIFYFPLVTLPFATVVSSLNWVNPIGWDWLILLLIGIFTQFGQYFLTIAYQTGNVSKVSSLVYFGIVYALIAGYFLFDETFTAMGYVGISFVILGILLNLRVKEIPATK